MSTVAVRVPQATTFYVAIPTSTQAKRKPETVVEFDYPVLAIRKGRAEELYDVGEIPCGFATRTRDDRGYPSIGEVHRPQMPQPVLASPISYFGIYVPFFIKCVYYPDHYCPAPCDTSNPLKELIYA